MMISSIQSNNGGFAAIGNPQTQVPANSNNAAANAQSKDSASANNYQKADVSDTVINTPLIIHDGAFIAVINNPTLDAIVGAISGPSVVTFNGINGAQKNQIGSISSNTTIVSQVQKPALVQISKLFEPYEQLTSISHDRPEIIMMTDYSPIFEGDQSQQDQLYGTSLGNSGAQVFMTSTGRFMDVQFQMMQLNIDNVIRSISSMSRQSASFRADATAKRASFASAINALNGTSRFLLNVLRNIDQLRKIFDLHNDFYVVEPQAIIGSTLTSNLSNAKFSMQGMLTAVQVSLPPKYTLADALVRYGFSYKAASESFSSTKLWLQSLYELSQALKYHTLELLDIDASQNRSDVSPVTILQPKIAYLGSQQSMLDVHPVAFLKDTEISRINAVIKNTQTAYTNFYSNVHFKSDESRVVGLCNFVAKEFRYSMGMASDMLKQALKDSYAYNVQDRDNRTMFDFIFGQFGSDITDASHVVQRSLSGVGQRVFPTESGTDFVVLPFETRYIASDRGTITPGSAYYVEELLRTKGDVFNTTRLEVLSVSLDSQLSNLKTLIDAMNLGSFPQSGDAPNAQSLATVYGSAPDLLTRLLSFIVADDNNASNILLTDPAAAVLSAAISDDKIKAMLFLIILMRATRSYQPGVEFPAEPSMDNTPVNDNLIDQIEAQIYSSAQTVDAAKVFKNLMSAGKEGFNVDRGVLKNSLRSGQLITAIGDLFTEALQAMGSFNVVKDEFTRYSGYPDAAMLMLLFDAVCTMVSKFSGQSVVGVYPSKSVNNLGVEYFIVSVFTKDWSSSIYAMKGRLDRESSSIQMLLYSIMSVMSKLSSALKGYINFFKNPDNVKQLNSVSSLMSDSSLLQYFLSEQQILLFTSAVTDLSERLSVSSMSQFTQDASPNDAMTLKVLDDTVVTTKAKDAMYRVFSGQDFTTKKGNNKRIITTGIPVGFTHRLLQSVVARGKNPKLSTKQGDIIKLVVYRIDMENADLVFKPQKFLFELSRYPVRNDQYYIELTDTSDALEAFYSIPTRNLGADSNVVVEYAVARKGTPSENCSVAFNDSSYSFLSPEQKFELIRDHNMSFMLESYIKLLTGLSVADQQFEIDPTSPMTLDSTFLKSVIDTKMAQIIQKPDLTHLPESSTSAPKSAGSLFSNVQSSINVNFGAGMNQSTQNKSNNSGTPGLIDISAQFSSAQNSSSPVNAITAVDVKTSLLLIQKQDVATAVQTMQTINSFSNMVTSLSDAGAVAKKLIQPKQFDRIFSVIVDPDDFEVDVDMTQRSDNGKAMLRQMIEQGKVTPVVDQLSLRQGAEQRVVYKFIEKDKNEGDIAFDKYFVAIESFDEAS